MLDDGQPDAVVIATPTHVHSAMVRRPWSAACTSSARSPHSTPPTAPTLTERGRATGPRHAGRLPQPFRRRRSPRPSGCSTSARSARSTRPGRGLRPGGPQAAGRTWRTRRARAAEPLRLRGAPARPAHVVPRRPGVGRRHQLTRSSRPRPRTRSTHAALPRRHGPAVGQLVGRVPAQDDDEGDAVGHPRPDLRGPPGDPGLPARDRRRSPRGTGRAGTSATPPSSPSRSGSTCAARSTARSWTTSCGASSAGERGRQLLRLGRRDRPGHRADQPRTRARGRSPVAGQRPGSAPTARGVARSPARARRAAQPVRRRRGSASVERWSA